MDIIISDASAVSSSEKPPLAWHRRSCIRLYKYMTVRQHVEKLLIDYDQLFFIFDRYNSDSIKGEEKLVRSKGVTRTYIVHRPARERELSTDIFPVRER